LITPANAHALKSTQQSKRNNTPLVQLLLLLLPVIP
jgi:hypothetical protein